MSEGNGSKRGLLIGGVLFVFAAGLAYGVHWWLNARYLVSTDNAYVGGNVVQITPQMARVRWSRKSAGRHSDTSS